MSPPRDMNFISFALSNLKQYIFVLLAVGGVVRWGHDVEREDSDFIGDGTSGCRCICCGVFVAVG